MLQDYGDEADSTLAAEAGYGSFAPPSKFVKSHMQMQEPVDDVLMREPVDYGRDYYLLLRKMHQERTACSNPTREELYTTFKILKESVSKSSMARVHSASQAESKIFANPYEKPAKAAAISKETQVRLAGSTFNEKTDLASNKTLATKIDLVAGRDPDSVRHTIKVHHDDYEREQEIFTKEEQFIIKRQRERKLKAAAAKKKEQEKKVQEKYVKSELYA